MCQAKGEQVIEDFEIEDPEVQLAEAEAEERDRDARDTVKVLAKALSPFVAVEIMERTITKLFDEAERLAYARKWSHAAACSRAAEALRSEVKARRSAEAQVWLGGLPSCSSVLGSEAA